MNKNYYQHRSNNCSDAVYLESTYYQNKKMIAKRFNYKVTPVLNIAISR